MKSGSKFLPTIQIMSNVEFNTFQLTAEGLSLIFEYLRNLYRSNLKDNKWILAYVDSTSYIRRRNITNNKILHMVEVADVQVNSPPPSYYSTLKNHLDITMHTPATSFTSEKETHKLPLYAVSHLFLLYGDIVSLLSLAPDVERHKIINLIYQELQDILPLTYLLDIESGTDGTLDPVLNKPLKFRVNYSLNRSVDLEYRIY